MTRRMTSFPCWPRASGKASSAATRSYPTRHCCCWPGHETTINLLCNGILSFHPQPRPVTTCSAATLRGCTSRANEECLRHDSSVQVHHPHRRRGRGTAGQGNQEGRPHPLVYLFGQPGPSQVREPGRLRHHPLAQSPRGFRRRYPPLPGRDPGAGLEGQEAFKAFAERFESLHLDTTEDQLEYQPSITFRSLKSLPITWN